VGALEYLNWNPVSSIVIDIFVFTGYTWLVDSFGLNRKAAFKREVKAP